MVSWGQVCSAVARLIKLGSCQGIAMREHIGTAWSRVAKGAALWVCLPASSVFETAGLSRKCGVSTVWACATWCQSQQL